MSIESVSEKPVFKNIQALRGIAALMVCCYHFSYLISESWCETAFSHGWLGVQIFFIISGFIMVHTTSGIKSHYQTGAWRFFGNRIIRIIPLYYLCTLLHIAPAIGDGFSDIDGDLLISSLLFIAPLTSHVGPEYGMPSLEVGWSLNYEMLFYAVFAIAILFRRSKLLFLYIVLLSAIFLIPILFAGIFPVSYRPWIDYGFAYTNVLTNPILIHFVFGITLGIIMPVIKVSRNLKIVILISTSLLFLSYYTGYINAEFTVWNDLFFCGLLVTGFLINDYGSNGIRFIPAMVKLGDMSYSIYLLHPIVIFFMKIAFHKAGYRDSINTVAFFVFALLMVLICSFIFYHFIEKRLTKYLKHKFIS